VAAGDGVNPGSGETRIGARTWACRQTRPLLRWGAKILAITLFVFVVLALTPGGAAGPQGQADRSLVGALAAYVHWLGAAVQGDLGHCAGEPIRARLGQSLGRTLPLVAAALAFSLVFSAALAALAAVWAWSRWVAVVVRSLTALSGAPLVVLALGAFALRWVDPNQGFSPWFVVILGLGNGTLVDYYTLLRQQIDEARQRDYVVAAQGRGASRARHAWRNELLVGLLDATWSRVPGLIGGTIVVEWVFAYTGLGYDIVKAVQDRHQELAMAVTAVVAVLLVSLGEGVERVRRHLDPRLS
jgi:ABC-type dipeptide/oligopeptide/nickel transport system permease component